MRGLDDTVAVADVLAFIAAQRIHQVIVTEDRFGRTAGGQQPSLAGLLVHLSAQPHAITRLHFRDPPKDFGVIEESEETLVEAVAGVEAQPEAVGGCDRLAVHDHFRGRGLTRLGVRHRADLQITKGGKGVVEVFGAGNHFSLRGSCVGKDHALLLHRRRLR